MKRASLAIAALLSAFLVPAAAQAATGYATTHVNMRSGPDIWYPAVAVVPAGTPVTVHGCLDAWSWCDVSSGWMRGWVSAAYLVVPYQNRRVIISDAPWLGLPAVTFHFGNYWDRHYRSRPFYRDRSRWEGRHREYRRGGRSGGWERSRQSIQEPNRVRTEQPAPQYQPQPEPQAQDRGAGRGGRGGSDRDWSRDGGSQTGEWHRGGDHEWQGRRRQ